VLRGRAQYQVQTWQSTNVAKRPREITQTALLNASRPLGKQTYPRMYRSKAVELFTLPAINASQDASAVALAVSSSHAVPARHLC
jgi:hypothetical protein